ncbi:chromosomal replication initiator DnaA (plasmid) [Rickettsia amblyommatis]|uniref:DnaA-like replication initiator protein n=2 Tax=Rickettsia amblyommatis TaxID=33989 RepID=H8K692_RICAG|nr:DnaA N-terminal domain-containing protein [Rickettsia amblyommatis]ADD14614.1 DnaA-like replication initiator protein [Rickettsia amblyommatis str. AaR/SC]AFC70403.1 DnaA-like replication initiator protein [Rickettsia amblyommatis str. GAT-30V]ARD88207.1 chromosomal replication initiator DnaA [Rickettsia amblyommatis]KJV98536.1 marR family protein [Rickettsia amblyommatis str. Darkwater]
MQSFYPLATPSDNVGIHQYYDTTKNQSYVPITGCVLSHILSSKELSTLEKMYYILADGLSCINFSKGHNRSISLPAKSWAERLSCSKSEVFVLQKSLEAKGHFIITRDKNDQGQNKRNIITTTIPDKVFNDLKYEPDRFDLGDIDNTKTRHSKSDKLDSIDNIFVPTIEGKRQHLEKTKMFIRVPYEFLKQLNSNCSISATAKTITLYLFTKIYKSSLSSNNDKGNRDTDSKDKDNRITTETYIDASNSNKNDYKDFYDHAYDHDHSITNNLHSIVTSYQELQKELKLHRNSISRALKDLEDNNLIKRDKLVIRNNDDYNSRADKSLWQISLLNISLINNNDQKKQKEQKQQIVIEYNNNKALEIAKEWKCTEYDPPCTDSGQLYSKDFVSKNSIIKNIDYIDVNLKNLSINDSSNIYKSEENFKKEFLGNEQSSFPSEFYNNSSFLNDSEAGCFVSKEEYHETASLKLPCANIHPEIVARTIKDISENKELRHFYPLSEKDVDILNFKANREFSTNFVNQLLLKLYIKYPEKKFKNKFIFLSYMKKVLASEKHQGPLVNHTTFRFSCNIGAEEQNMLEHEQYLSQIENSFDTSKEMQVKKKIAGRFSTSIAYSILTQVEFKISANNSFITVLIPSNLALSERQIEILSEQLETVYGMNGYYVQKVEEVEDTSNERKRRDEEKVMLYPKIITSDVVSDGTHAGILAKSGGLDTIEANTAWHHIRQGLIEELGEAMYTAWFEKAVVKECNDTSTLKFTMPARFIADWVRNNYSHVIQRLGSSAGVKRVEYGY